MLRFESEPPTTVCCSWKAYNDDGHYYWKGCCEGDKEAMVLDELTLLPEHFVGRVILEQIHVCPKCGLEIFTDDEGWVCTSC